MLSSVWIVVEELSLPKVSSIGGKRTLGQQVSIGDIEIWLPCAWALAPRALYVHDVWLTMTLEGLTELAPGNGCNAWATKTALDGIALTAPKVVVSLGGDDQR